MKELTNERMKELTIKKKIKDMKANIKKMANGLRMTGYGIMVISMLWLCAPVEAQVLVDEVQPAATFQSTSTMTGSGSVYSSNPVLNEEGSASYSPAKAPGRTGGIRKDVDPPSIDVPDPVVDIDPEALVDNPVGDAVLPLLLMALAFGAWRFRRVRD